MTKPLSIKKSTKSASPEKEAAEEDLQKKEDYLSPHNTVNARFDIDKHLHKQVKFLANDTICREIDKQGHVNFKTVSIRMLFTEAVIDLLDKYAKGDGKYMFEDPDTIFNWRK